MPWCPTYASSSRRRARRPWWNCPALPGGVTVANGQYVANMCIGCHGADLSGGKIPGGPPDWPAAADIRPGANSAMARYPNAASFVAMLRTGKRPDGTPIQVMPFESLGQRSEEH